MFTEADLMKQKNQFNTTLAPDAMTPLLFEDIFDDLPKPNPHIIPFRGNENQSYITSTRYIPQITSLPNLSTLTPGDHYTYKDLCTILEQPTKVGNAKAHQLVEFQRFFNFEKIGRKYKIINILETPLPYLPINETVPANSKYLADIINIIISYLYNLGEDTVYLSHLDLSIICGLANYLYKKNYTEINFLSETLSLDADYITDFYNRSFNKMRDILKSSLQSMEDRQILQYIPTYIIVYKESTASNTYSLYEATDKDRISIMEMQYMALKELGLTSMNELWYYPESYRTKYKKTINEYMRESQPYWLNFYKTVKLIVNPSGLYEESSASAARQSLNTKMFKFLNNQAVKESAKYIKKADQNGSSDQDSYIKAQQTLNEWLIKLF